MSTCQSLRLVDAALWDSIESGDISMDCLSPKCLYYSLRRKKKPNKIGQHNLVGGRSDNTQFSQWFRLLRKEKRNREQSKEEYLQRSVRAMGGRLRNILTYESVWCDWVNSEWNLWWSIWGLLMRQKGRWGETKKFKFGKGNLAVIHWRDF